ncbi:MAG: hypothetical protein N3D84_01765 [Candidatus Woesearchaeota archaeon]|nr:hypothetical protein [Candidatus Woesearchaeota archaeon]
MIRITEAEQQNRSGINPPIRILRSPINFVKLSLLAEKRSKRGGMTENLEGKILNLFEIKPYPCDTIEFNSRPYYEKKMKVERDGKQFYICPFQQGFEDFTTEEHARVVNKEIIVHEKPIFPGQPGADIRLIDNKNPLFDLVCYDTGYRYTGNVIEDGCFFSIDAKGKDYVLIKTKHHIATPLHIDYFNISKLEQIFTKKELEKNGARYVLVGSNNAGLPKLVMPPYGVEGEDEQGKIVSILTYLFEKANPTLDGRREEMKKFIETLISNARGYYESIGYLSGASQPHPHGRIISMPLLPPWIEHSYKSSEELSKKTKKNVYEMLMRDEWLIVDDGKFAIIANPTPDHSGEIMLVAKEAHNLTELTDEELWEFSNKRRLAQTLIDMRYSALPSNTYTLQTFGDDIEKYPATRLIMVFSPRTSTKAVLELGTHIDAYTTMPETVAKDMIYIIDKFGLKRTISNLFNPFVPEKEKHWFI